MLQTLSLLALILGAAFIAHGCGLFHLAAATVSIGQTANTALTPISDQVLTINGNFFMLPNDMKLQAAFAMSTTLNRARLNVPSLRLVALPQIRPIMTGNAGPTDPSVQDLRGIPLTIPGLENFGVDATSDLGMGNEQCWGTLWLSNGDLTPAPAGELITIRFTGTTAAVANTWTDITMAPDDALGEGDYAIVGGDWVSASAIAFRLILNNQTERPGGLGIAAIGSRAWYPQYGGGMGTWGRFRSTALPRFQALCRTTDNAHTCFLQVVRLAPILA
jgi:hypothetical protein